MSHISRLCLKIGLYEYVVRTVRAPALMLLLSATALDQQARVPLSPWANYTFHVVAVNSIGTSDRSSFTNVCVTPPQEPYKSPENLCTASENPDQLVITWEVRIACYWFHVISSPLTSYNALFSQAASNVSLFTYRHCSFLQCS